MKFTLIEVLVVIVILVILIGMLFPVIKAGYGQWFGVAEKPVFTQQR